MFRLALPDAKAGIFEVKATIGGQTIAVLEFECVEQPANLWKLLATANMQPSAPFTAKVQFAADIALTKSAAVTVFGRTALSFKANGKDLDIVFDGPIQEGNRDIVISGVMYPKLFPSYSFTFRVEVASITV